MQTASAPVPVFMFSDYVFVPTVVRALGWFKKELDLGSGNRTFMLAAKGTHSDGRADRHNKVSKLQFLGPCHNDQARYSLVTQNLDPHPTQNV